MKLIQTIDLWTEQYENQYECFNGAFVDGWEKEKKPFDEYKIVKNCNCFITVDRKDFLIRNKHHAIIFYQHNIPVRLVVINKNTDIAKCIHIALTQFFQNTVLKNIYEQSHVKSTEIDLKELAIHKEESATKEIDVGSCDRWSLLFNMLKGSYTESNTSYGNFQSDKYEFIPNLSIKYNLTTDTETFEIDHECGFINELKTRIIPIQKNSKLVLEKNE